MKTLLFIMMLAATLQAKAGDNDTLRINKPGNVTIITGDSLQKIIVRGREGDPDYVYRNTIQLVDSNYVSNVSINKDRWDLSVGVGKKRDDGSWPAEIELHVGVGGALFLDKQQGVHLKDQSSYEIFTELTANTFLSRQRKDWLSFGLGLVWNHYYASKDFRFYKDANGDTQIGRYAEGQTPKSSHVKTFGYTGSILYHHMFDRKWGLGAGMYVQKNFSSRVKVKYKEEGKTVKESEKHANVNKSMFGWMGVVYTPVIDLYVKYSPEYVLSGDGAKFKTITVGIRF